MQDNPISEFEELREEARITVENERFDNKSRRWATRIWILLTILFLISCALAAYSHELAIIGGWAIIQIVGFSFCRIAAFVLAFIPFSRNWKHAWRTHRLFQIMYLFFLLLQPLLLAVAYFGVPYSRSFF